MNDASVLEIEPGQLEMIELEETECLFSYQDIAFYAAITVSVVLIGLVLC